MSKGLKEHINSYGTEITYNSEGITIEKLEEIFRAAEQARKNQPDLIMPPITDEELLRELYDMGLFEESSMMKVVFMGGSDIAIMHKMLEKIKREKNQ